MEDAVILRERLKGVEASVENLERWQASQNGTIRSVDSKVSSLNEKVDKLIFWAMSSAVGVCITLIGGLLFFLIERQ